MQNYCRRQPRFMTTLRSPADIRQFDEEESERPIFFAHRLLMPVVISTILKVLTGISIAAIIGSISPRIDIYRPIIL